MPNIEQYANAVGTRTTQVVASLLAGDGSVVATFPAWSVDQTGSFDVSADSTGASFLNALRTYRLRYDPRISFGALFTFSDDETGAIWRIRTEVARIGRKAWLEVDVTAETAGDVTGPVDVVQPGRVLLGADFAKEGDAVYDPHYSYPVMWTQGMELDLVSYPDYSPGHPPTARAAYEANECHTYPVNDYRRYDMPGSLQLAEPPVATVGSFRWVWTHTDGTRHISVNPREFGLATPSPGKVASAVELHLHVQPSAPTHTRILELLNNATQNWPEPASSVSIGEGTNNEPVMLDTTYDPSTGGFAVHPQTFRRIREYWGEVDLPDVTWGVYSFEKWRAWHMTNSLQLSPTLGMGNRLDSRGVKVADRPMFYVRSVDDGQGAPNWASNIGKDIWAQLPSGQVVKIGRYSHPATVGEHGGTPYLVIGGSVSHWQFAQHNIRLDSPVWVGTTAPGGVPNRWLITSVHGG